MNKWDRLKNYICDWAYGISPDETTPDCEKHDRSIIYETLQEVLTAMADIERSNIICP